jgi:hypothetical protein
MIINEAFEAAKTARIFEYQADAKTLYLLNNSNETWVLYPSKGGAAMVSIKGAEYRHPRFDFDAPLTITNFKDPYIRQALAVRIVTLFFLPPSMESDTLKGYLPEDLAQTRQAMQEAGLRPRDLWEQE